MTKMTPELLEECKKILDALIASKLSDFFMDPIYDDNDEYSNYTEIIENPQFFSFIQEKLRQGKYHTFSEFQNDIDLVFSNTRKYFGEDTYQTIVADELSKQFKKLCRKLTCTFSNQAWSSELTNIYNKLTLKMQNSPPSLKNKLNIKNAVDSISPQDLSNFSKAANQLKDTDDVLGMLQLLNAGGLHIDPQKDHIYVNLKSIPSSTILPLIAYTKERFKDLNLNYPA